MGRDGWFVHMMRQNLGFSLPRSIAGGYSQFQHAFFNSVIGEYGPGAILVVFFYVFFPFCRPLEMHHSAAFFNDNPHG